MILRADEEAALQAARNKFDDAWREKITAPAAEAFWVDKKNRAKPLAEWINRNPKRLRAYTNGLLNLHYPTLFIRQAVFGEVKVDKIRELIISRKGGKSVGAKSYPGMILTFDPLGAPHDPTNHQPK